MRGVDLTRRPGSGSQGRQLTRSALGQVAVPDPGHQTSTVPCCEMWCAILRRPRVMKRRLHAETALEKENSGTKQTSQNSPPTNTCAEFVLEQLLEGARRLHSAHQVLKCGAQRVLFWCVQVHNILPTDRTTRRQRWPDCALGRVCEFDPEWMSTDIAPTAHGVVASEVMLRSTFPTARMSHTSRRCCICEAANPRETTRKKGGLPACFFTSRRNTTSPSHQNCRHLHEATHDAAAAFGTLAEP